MWILLNSSILKKPLHSCIVLFCCPICQYCVYCSHTKNNFIIVPIIFQFNCWQLYIQIYHSLVTHIPCIYSVECIHNCHAQLSRPSLPLDQPHGIFTLRQFPLCQFPFCQFPFCQFPFGQCWQSWNWQNGNWWSRKLTKWGLIKYTLEKYNAIYMNEYTSISTVQVKAS